MQPDNLEEGILAGGLPYRAVGRGTPLVYLPPLHRIIT